MKPVPVVDLPGEEWREVPGYDGRYEVSNLGRVRFRRMVAGRSNQDGYPVVPLCATDGKVREVPVHALVLAAFVGPRPDGAVCRHLDGSRTNNTVGNLSYGTQKENWEDTRRHGRVPLGEAVHTSKLTEAAVTEIINRREAGERRIDLAREYGVHPATIRNICSGASWKHIDVIGNNRKPKRAVGQQHPCAKLSNDDVQAIRRLGAEGAHYTKIAKRFGVGATAIWKILHGLLWRSVEADNAIPG